MNDSLQKITRGILWVIPALAYSVFAPTAFAAYISPAGSVYPSASYSVNEDISNGNASAVTVTNDWFYGVNGGDLIPWCHQTNTVPANKTITVSCGSTGDVAGTVMKFQVNTWRPDYNGTVSWSTTGFTVQPPPTASAVLSVSPSTVAYGGGAYLYWSSSYTSSCTLTGFGSVSTNNASGYFTGSLTNSTTYTLSCIGASPATNNPSSSATVTVNPPPIVNYLLSTGTNGSGSISCNSGSCSSSYQSGTALTLTASPSSGYSFSGWSGDCSGTGSCALTMNSNKSVTANFSQLTASASFSNPTNGYTLNYNGGTYFTWVSSNTTGCSISSSPALSGYPKTGLPVSNSGTNYWSGNLKDSVVFTLNCTPVSGASGTPSSSASVYVRPPPSGNCTVSFNNTISGVSERNWRINVSGSTVNCPADYFQNLTVAGTAGVVTVDDRASPTRVFDFDWYGVARYIDDISCNTVSYIRDLQKGTYNAMPGPLGGTVCGENLPANITDLHFSKPIANSGSWSSPYESAYKGSSDIDFGISWLPWGNYKFSITNTLTGIYKCPDGDVPINIPVSLQVCAYEPNEGGGLYGEGRYYDSECTVVNPNRASVPLTCPSAPVTVVLDVPPPPPPPGERLIFEHKLSVQSKLDDTSKPGVDITQISVSDPDPNFEFPANYFAGITDYTRLAERNFTVVLEAPSSRESPASSFTGWTGDCALVPGNPRQCSVSFVFSVLGGQTKTVFANYTSKLDAPALTTSTPSCDATGGKVNVYLQSAVSGATGYKLYRKSASTVASLVKDFSAASAPFSGNPYTDSTGTPNTTYYYTMTAYNSSANSPASAEISRAASLPCPDLIVEPGSVQIIDTASPPNVLDPTVVPANTSIKFRAKIRNQNGATPPLSSPGFYNEFVLDGQTTPLLFSPSQMPLSGLGQGALSDFLTTGSWVPTVGGHSLQVCADYPLELTGTGKIFEMNIAGNAEQNNCLTSPFSFSVVTPISVQLEVGPTLEATKFKNDYIIVDYEDAPKLRWKVSGNPTTCAASANTDWTGAKVKDSYTATNNPFSLGKLLSKLSFIYQLDCTR